MTAFPNIEALAEGRVSGQFCEWPDMRGEARSVVAEIDALRERAEKAEEGRDLAVLAMREAEARVKVLDAYRAWRSAADNRMILWLYQMEDVHDRDRNERLADCNLVVETRAATGPLPAKEGTP